jgi:hypothetical protein
LLNKAKYLYTESDKIGRASACSLDDLLAEHIQQREIIVREIRFLMGCLLPAYIEENSESGISSCLEDKRRIWPEAEILLAFLAISKLADVGQEPSAPHATKPTGRLKICRSQDTSPEGTPLWYGIWRLGQLTAVLNTDEVTRLLAAVQATHHGAKPPRAGHSPRGRPLTTLGDADQVTCKRHVTL